MKTENKRNSGTSIFANLFKSKVKKDLNIKEKDPTVIKKEIIDDLLKFYITEIKSIEYHSKFDLLNYPTISKINFEAAPICLVIGP